MTICNSKNLTQQVQNTNIKPLLTALPECFLKQTILFNFVVKSYKINDKFLIPKAIDHPELDNSFWGLWKTKILIF